MTWCPFDHVLCVRRFVRELAPRMLVLIETEIWPNMLRETRRQGVPVVMVNGRLSDRHYPGYWRLRRFLKPVLAQISLAAMQNAEYAERLVTIGVERSRVHVSGSTKFDGVCTQVDGASLARLRVECDLPEGAPVLIFGSTRPGDEALAAECWQELRNEFSELLLVIAPRHSERMAEAIAPFNEPIIRRSEIREGRCRSGERVLVLDTVGELVMFYALATVAVVGGSFYPGVNGHNPLEPAGLGVPTVFGPYMRNFVDPARELVNHGGAIQVDGPGKLAGTLRKLLTEPETRGQLAVRGREAVAANQGAIVRTLDLLETVLPKIDP